MEISTTAPTQKGKQEGETDKTTTRRNITDKKTNANAKANEYAHANANNDNESPLSFRRNILIYGVGAAPTYLSFRRKLRQLGIHMYSIVNTTQSPRRRHDKDKDKDKDKDEDEDKNQGQNKYKGKQRQDKDKTKKEKEKENEKEKDKTKT
jgi:hypothetical protein